MTRARRWIDDRGRVTARRLRLGAIVVAALGLGAASALLEACKSLAGSPSVGDTPQEASPIVPMGSSTVIVSAVPPPASSPPVGPDVPDGAADASPDAPG
jgi:hypothetical protein